MWSKLLWDVKKNYGHLSGKTACECFCVPFLGVVLVERLVGDGVVSQVDWMQFQGAGDL